MIYATLPTLDSLPPSMLSRARWARDRILNHPSEVVVDEEDLLAWVYNEEDGVWYSIAGNYSKLSPTQKAEKRKAFEEKQLTYKQASDERHIEQLYWSKVRRQILERDGYACQLCGTVKTPTSPLHIHHILKRTQGGTDHDDNLITVCPSCHKKADTTLYDPAWKGVPNV